MDENDINAQKPMDSLPDRITRSIATYLDSADAFNFASSDRRRRDTICLSSLIVWEQKNLSIPLPSLPRSRRFGEIARHRPARNNQNNENDVGNAVAVNGSSNRVKFIRLHIPLAHKTQSVFCRLKWHWNPLTALNVRAQVYLFVVGHAPSSSSCECYSFDQGTVVFMEKCPSTISFVPKPTWVYNIWTYAAGIPSVPEATLLPCVDVSQHTLIFDTPVKNVLNVYNQLYSKMGPLHAGGLVYLRLLQSLTHSLLLSLRFNTMPNPGLWSILNDIIEIDKNDWAAISTREIITTLAEIVTWSEEDLTKMEQGEDVGSLCKHNRQGPPSDQQEEQLRPPARREEIPMVLMHEQHQHLMMVRRQRRRLVNHRRLDNPGFAFVFGENALGRPQNNNVGAPP
mmetsp:Transcript_1337/g.2021  ORF Transcript_1337/g.2021 Transcript_1337/m.2021 type:complete len:398 (+) Transcript_1337:137-1330(+)